MILGDEIITIWGEKLNFKFRKKKYREKNSNEFLKNIKKLENNSGKNAFTKHFIFTWVKLGTKFLKNIWFSFPDFDIICENLTLIVLTQVTCSPFYYFLFPNAYFAPWGKHKQVFALVKTQNRDRRIQKNWISPLFNSIFITNSVHIWVNETQKNT